MPLIWRMLRRGLAKEEAGGQRPRGGEQQARGWLRAASIKALIWEHLGMCREEQGPGGWTPGFGGAGVVQAVRAETGLGPGHTEPESHG